MKKMSTITADRNDIASRLLELPRLLNEAEREVAAAQRILVACKEDLADREAALILAGVSGSNAEQRAAYVRQGTVSWRMALQQAQEEAQLAAVRLRTLQAEHSSLRSVARLLSGEHSD
jgi:hypothetical protein